METYIMAGNPKLGAMRLKKVAKAKSIKAQIIM
jgi:hypothetical protein